MNTLTPTPTTPLPQIPFFTLPTSHPRHPTSNPPPRLAHPRHSNIHALDFVVILVFPFSLPQVHRIGISPCFIPPRRMS